jgi:hypothetical protein
MRNEQERFQQDVLTMCHKARASDNGLTFDELQSALWDIADRLGELMPGEQPVNAAKVEGARRA